MPLKHTYTEAEAPRNTGSATRPARFNMRLTCSARARTHAVLQGLREAYGMPRDAAYADVWEERALLILEHHLRTLRTGETALVAFTKAQAAPLPPQDHMRARYEQMRMSFDPAARAEKQRAANAQ